MASPHRSTRVLRSSVVSFDSSAMLTIKVGPAASCRSFFVHESFLTARSGFFRRAMNGNWTESKTRTINLSEDDPEIFSMYLNHLYKNELPTMALSEEELCALTVHEFLGHIHEEYDALSKLYILAEKLQDGMAKDEAITAIFQLSSVRSSSEYWKYWNLPFARTLNLIYNGTPQGSPLRLLCVDRWSNASPVLLKRFEKGFPRDFLFDLAMALRRKLPRAEENVAQRKGVTAYLEAAKSSQKQKQTPPPEQSFPPTESP